MDRLVALLVGCVIGVAWQDDEHGFGRGGRVGLAYCHVAVADWAMAVDLDLSGEGGCGE